MFFILLDSFLPSMHSIPIHKYPSPPYTTYTHTIPSSLFFPQTMKHYNPTHYHLMYMNSKFPSCEVATFHQEPFGGFTWPPRSYTCTFCRREFRSAQALGGHMNVHRKDRARLKQSSLAPEIIHHQKQTCDPYQENFSGFSDPHLLQLSPPIFTDNDEDFVETKLSMGIDSVRKKHKKSSSVVSSPLQFINSQVCSSDRGSGGSSMEEIDLELRLGDPTAVK